MKPPLTPEEIELEAAVKEGREAFESWKEGQPRPTIRARFVEELVLAADADSGVQLRGASISEGPIDLKDARGSSGAACNALILTDCVLYGKQPNTTGGEPGIDASHSHLQRLSLVNCQTDGVELSSAVIVGDLDLDGIHPRSDDNPRACWIKARGVRIGGFVTARKARLSLPWPEVAKWPPADAHHRWHDRHAAFAFDLQGAQIAGSLILQPEFESLGGVSVSAATIGGAFWAEGAHITAASKETPALSLYSASLSTDVRLDRGDFAEIPCEISTMDLRTATIGGKLMMEGSADAPIQRVDATGLRVAGDLTLSGSFFVADLSGSVTNGDLKLGTAGNSEDIPFALVGTRSGKPSELKLVGAWVGRALKVAVPIRTPEFGIDLAKAEHLVRAVDLLSYPGWRLAEAILWSGATPEVAALLAFLYRPDGQADVVILNGKSDPFHQLNDKQPPVLDREDHVEEYLSLFCNHLWGDEGVFRLLDPTKDNQPDDGDAGRVLPRGSRDGPWHAEAKVEYGNVQYETKIQISPSGAVWMAGDEPIGEAPERPVVRYARPIRLVGVQSLDPDDIAWLVPSPLRSREFAPDPTFAKPSSFSARISSWLHREPRWKDVQNEVRRDLEEQPRPSIDLAGLKAGSLDDAEGENWGARDVGDWGRGPKFRLHLSGFEYGRIDDSPDPPPPENPLARSEPKVAVDPRHRRNWLKAQYERYPPTADKYRPQPYQHLARVWRTEGNFTEADDITYDKLRLEKVLLSRPGLRHRLSRPLWWLVQELFGYGLRWKRAGLTFLAVYLVGLAAVLFIPLKIDASPVATVVGSQSGGERVVVEEAPIVEAREEISCGDHVNELVYPLDVMIPLIDLRQETRCQFSIKNWALSAGKGLYAIIGWLVTSGLILTLSGVVRRRLEG